MKLKKFNKNRKQKNIIFGFIIALVVIIGGIRLIASFAMYEEKQTFDVLKGTVPDFNKADIKLAITLDGEPTDEIPQQEEGIYYNVEVECDNDAVGIWNYNKWNIEVSNFKNGTKCNVSFQSSEVSKNNTVIDGDITRVTKSFHLTSTVLGQSYIRTTTFDFSDIEGYKNLTENNFIAYEQGTIKLTNLGWFEGMVRGLTYNSNNGIVTVSYYFNTTDNLQMVGSSGEHYYNIVCVCVYS